MAFSRPLGPDLEWVVFIRVQKVGSTSAEHQAQNLAVVGSGGLALTSSAVAAIGGICTNRSLKSTDEPRDID